VTRWVGTQSQAKWTKKAKTSTHCDITHRKPQTKELFFEPKPEDLPNAQRI